ncbi:VOC family protein [Hoyosella altamirensis]|uniref:Catechol 2,3-dioxygenase-like lactoylglutathione lyase family enzyme n=1 Tax=Hoyosella altamirensis TaxID=616997 RepID=A0A839RLD8_9ACTN|nr:VOC family protein [Hoyosella altamirensis]MBB3037722.1 catechol 2,3-dioxygenase-like lactoylglutathione lyase family enzyme [Hoyosella altamirensis]
MQILSSRIILRPSDYERTLNFYRDVLGLAIYREYPGGTVFFAGQGLIEVASHGRASDRGAFTGALWLQTRDIAAAQTELETKGITIRREAIQEPWGLIEMWIEDPDEIPIVLVEIPADHPLRGDQRPARDT